MTVNDEIMKIKEVILKTVPAQKIYMFGSYVNGTFGKDSDYDFYVVVPDGSIRPIDAMEKIGMAVYNIQTTPVDILVGNSSGFAKRSLKPTIERTIARDGVILYDE